MNKDIVQKARALMKRQTQKNKAPAWVLTEMAIKKGKELSKRYDVDENMVLTSLYLAHTIFSTVVKGKIQKNHTTLSSRFSRPYLKKWGVGKKEQDIILNAIEAHHGKVKAKSRVAVIMKNAECFKFVTLKGCLIYLDDLKRRGYPQEDAIKKVLDKMEAKRRLLTLKECKEEAERKCKQIRQILSQSLNRKCSSCAGWLRTKSFILS